MLSKLNEERRQRRRMRIRKTIVGSTERPRLTVYKSSKHLYAQLIDDSAGKTIAFATTNTKAVKGSGKKSFANVESAKAVGKELGEKAKAAGVTSVVFDRNGFSYHGIVKAVAEAAREAGLKF